LDEDDYEVTGVKNPKRNSVKHHGDDQNINCLLTAEKSTVALSGQMLTAY